MDRTPHSTSDGLESPFASGSCINADRVTPGSIDLKNVKAEATWQSHRLPVRFSLYCNSGSKAILKLQVRIETKPNLDLSDSDLSDPAAPSKPIYLHLLISPERIRQLSVGPSNNLSGSVSRTLNFVLSVPPFLIVPQDPWEPRDDVSKATKALLYSLAGQTHFTISVTTPESVVSDDDVREFCTAACAGRLFTDGERGGPASLCRNHAEIIEGASISPEALVPEYSESSPAPGSAPMYRRSPATSGK